ncbi:ABC transporter G family member 32-like [Asparagus officinalis]|uniref:ABC transporter G family member 32-like n=1 Tax=Asparagus officinalis TaxID=4686 RepID=UPI00098E5D2F|nr:ABC transporter G family member 32-like [Asparagus officinalis]
MFNFSGSLDSFWSSYLSIKWHLVFFGSFTGLTRQMIIANTVGSFALLMIMVLGGFVIGRDDVKKCGRNGGCVDTGHHR